jgi:hypothetical protein
MKRPGELVHVDIKKLGRIPKGGGWRAHGRSKEHHGGRHKVGCAYIHTAIDGYSRLAYAEVFQRTKGLARWLHIYNHDRHHTAVGGPPIGRVGKVSGHYS